MSKNEKVVEELQIIMTEALLNMQKLCGVEKTQLFSFTKIFLMGVISTAAEILEASEPSLAHALYADVEAVAKSGGLRSIMKHQRQNGGLEYSVSDIRHGDYAMAMNYLGHHLSADLFRHLHELPESMRKPEMLLRGIEALLTNLLNQKFDASHEVLDSFCEHVHMSLKDLVNREQNPH